MEVPICAGWLRHPGRMKVEGVDRRDAEWEVEAPAYRVYFYGDGGSYADEYQLTDADVDEVLSWAQERADGRVYVVYVVRDERGSLGLIRLAGRDPNEHP